MCAEEFDSAFLRGILDAMPLPVFLVDDDVSVIFSNEAAKQAFGREGIGAKVLKGGEYLHCVNSLLTGEGCGHSRPCGGCAIRNSVGKSKADNTTHRQSATMKMNIAGRETDASLLVSVSPFEHKGRRLSLLVLEDVSEIVKLRGLLPICAWCKKIRSDDDYWTEIELYLQQHMDMDFTHGICNECAEKTFGITQEDD